MRLSNPVFIKFGVAADRAYLFLHIGMQLLPVVIHFRQFIGACYLNSPIFTAALNATDRVAHSKIRIPEKTNKLQHLNLSAMEIDISDWAAIAWTWERQTDTLLNEPQRWYWLKAMKPLAEVSVMDFGNKADDGG